MYQLTREQKQAICIRELYGKERFLRDYSKELERLQGNREFMSIITRIAHSVPAKGMYGDPLSDGLLKFKYVLCDVMKSKDPCKRFSAYRTIFTRMKESSAAANSVHISVFYAMQYLDL